MSAQRTAQVWRWIGLSIMVGVPLLLWGGWTIYLMGGFQ